ncbi:MAG: lectin-like domain-containing protein [Adhaeribacter sp.]
MPASPDLPVPAFFPRLSLACRRLLHTLLVSLLLALGPVAAQQIDPEAFILSGSAQGLTGNCFQLTDLGMHQTGGLFYNNRILLTQDFDLEFDINFGDRDQNGADGLAFVLQRSGTGMGASGEGLGYQGLSPSLAVEFDTWQNAYDPAYDHIGLQRNGNPNHLQAGIVAPVMAHPTSTNIEDGLPHRVRLQWQAAGKTLRVYFDTVLRVSLTEDLVNTNFSGNPTVYWGFTAATGGSANRQTVCLVKTIYQETLKADISISHARCPAANDGSITVSGKGGQSPYQYSLNNGSSFQTSSLFAGLAPGTYQVRIKDASGALSPAEAATVTEPGSILVTTALTPGCSGLAANQLQVSGSGGTAPYSFSIDGGASWQATGLFPNLAAGTYPVQVKDRNGCVAASSTVVTSLPEITTSIAGNPAEGICAGEAVTLTRQGPDNAGAVYTWLPAPGLSSTGATAVARPGVTTTYTLVSTTPGGCTEQDQVTVVVKPKPLADAGPDLSFCSGETVTLGKPAVAGYTYRWASQPGLSDLTAAQALFTATNTGTRPDTLHLVRTATLNGCLASDTVRVVVYPLPVNQRLLGSASVCPGVSGVSYKVANAAAAGYEWEINGGSIVAGQGTGSVTVNWGASSAGAWIKASGRTVYGCPLEALVLPVRINPLLITPKPAGPALLCSAEASDVAYETQFTPGSVYTWTVTGGTLVSPTTSHQARVRWDTNRRGKLVVTESSTTNLAVCFGASDTLYVDFQPSPLASLALQGPASVCAGARQVSYTLDGFAGSAYRWTLNGQALAPAANTVSLDLSEPGTYTLAVVETSAQGCTGPLLSKSITVHPLPVAATIVGPTNICPENQDGHVYTLAGGAGATYAWSVQGGRIRSGQGSGSIVVDFDASPQKAVTVLETSAAGCPGQLRTLAPRYDASFLHLTQAGTGEADAGKVELRLALSGDEGGGNGQVIRIYRKEAGAGTAWTSLAEISNSATSYVDASADPHQQAYYYRLENVNNCGTTLASAIHKTMLLQVQADEASETVTLQWNTYRGWPVQGYRIYRKLDQAPDFTLYKTVPAGDSTAVFASGAEGFVQQFRIQALAAGGSTAFSWSNIATATFANVPAFFNIFTPNGDGQNETFFVEHVDLYPGNELSVFNRYGKEVFRQSDYRNTWSGQGLSAGTYYYLFKLKTGQAFKGWVEIVR